MRGIIKDAKSLISTTVQDIVYNTELINDQSDEGYEDAKTILTLNTI